MRWYVLLYISPLIFVISLVNFCTFVISCRRHISRIAIAFSFKVGTMVEPIEDWTHETCQGFNFDIADTMICIWNLYLF